MKQIRVVLADDHPTFRAGINSIIILVEGIVVVGEASNGEEAIELVKNKNADVLVLDMQMPNMNGIDVVRNIKQIGIDVKILILSAFQSVDYVFSVVDLGVSGYLLKKEPLPVIVRSIFSVFNDDGLPFSEEIMQNLKRGKNKNNKSILSKREQDVMALLTKGLTNYSIGQELGISENTIKNHLANIYAKLSVKSRSEAILWACSNGYIKS